MGGEVRNSDPLGLLLYGSNILDRVGSYKRDPNAYSRLRPDLLDGNSDLSLRELLGPPIIGRLRALLQNLGVLDEDWFNGCLNVKPQWRNDDKQWGGYGRLGF